MIPKPTHFIRDTVKHKIVFCKINFKIPPPPKYSRKFWHFDRAKENSIKAAVLRYPWELSLGKHNPNPQVDILNDTILNIMSNFVPNEVKTINPREPEWMNSNIKKLSRKRNKVFKKYKRNGYKSEDKEIVDRLRNECQQAIVNAKENYLKNLGLKLADPSNGQKSYWKFLNNFLNKCKILKIPPILVDDKYITDC